MNKLNQVLVNIIHYHTKPFRRCIVKPNEQLVLVSYTYHYASTPNLSTS